MQNIIKVEMDILYDFYDTHQYREELAKFNVSDELIELYGPGGGNPNVYLCAPRPQIEALLEYWDYAADEIEFFIDGD